MKKINLRTDEFKVKSSSSGSASLVFGVILLVLVAAAFGWFRWEKQRINSEKEDIKSQIAQKQAYLDKTSFKEVYNFEGRVLDLEKQMASYANPVASLSEIASATFPETYFSNLDIESKPKFDSYKGSIIVPDFPALARQISAFNNLQGIKNLVLSNSGYTEEGVKADLSFEIYTSDQEDK